jgi:hypothetical protein
MDLIGSEFCNPINFCQIQLKNKSKIGFDGVQILLPHQFLQPVLEMMRLHAYVSKPMIVYIVPINFCNQT